MGADVHLHRRQIVVFAFLLWGLLPHAVAAGTHVEDQWQTLETEYAVVYYQSQEDLRRFHDAIDFGPDEWTAKRILNSQGNAGLEKKLANKVDALFERVRVILDMKPKMARVRIQVHPDRKSLAGAYEGLFKDRCRVRSWYLHENNTIYINSRDMNQGILAHEMGHAVSDHFLVIRPPRVSAEVWSMYVEAHLLDD